MAAIAIRRADAWGSLRANLRSAILTLLRAALQRLATAYSDVAPDFFRHPFP